MSMLKIILIDVGWGDSILLETSDAHGNPHFALVDSNDTSTLRSSHIFLKRYFEKYHSLNIPTTTPLFDWILLSHAHADHGQGLKRIFKDYGTQRFWYPRSNSKTVFFTGLLRYARRSSRVVHHQAIDNMRVLPSFGQVAMEVLWPNQGTIDNNENNNSVVLVLTIGNLDFVLTGDAEVDVWVQIANRLPVNTAFFKVPHHGSDDAMFDTYGNTPWLDAISTTPSLAISSHVWPFSHPSAAVITKVKKKGNKCYRTDEHYHITFKTDGQIVYVKYSHV